MCAGPIPASVFEQRFLEKLNVSKNSLTGEQWPHHWQSKDSTEEDNPRSEKWFHMGKGRGKATRSTSHF
jgi:hypothetical protein